MNIKEIIELGEGSRTEFKQEMPNKKTCAALFCAFANTVGGDLLIGVADNFGEILGVSENEVIPLERTLAEIAHNLVEPSILPIINLVRLDKKTIIHCHIDMGFAKPYRSSADNNVYVRVGSSTRRADPQTISYMSTESKGRSWDSLPCQEASIEIADQDIISEYCRLRNDHTRLSSKVSDVKKWLVSMDYAIQFGEQLCLTNAGVLLFTAKPNKFIPSCGLAAARFKGTTSEHFLDKTEFNGPIWQIYEKADHFFRQHIPLRATRTSSHRQEHYAYPPVAFREFMINALVHRTYGIETSTTKFAIFDDVIEVTNSGSLPFGLELEDIGRGVSRLRNPLIAKAFHDIGLIEGWGSGILVAQEALTRAKLPLAKFTAKGFFTQVSSRWSYGLELTELQQAIISMADSDGIITSAKVAENLNVTERTARNHLTKLADMGVAEKKGSTRGAAYILV